MARLSICLDQPLAVRPTHAAEELFRFRASVSVVALRASSDVANLGDFLAAFERKYSPNYPVVTTVDAPEPLQGTAQPVP